MEFNFWGWGNENLPHASWNILISQQEFIYPSLFHLRLIFESMVVSSRDMKTVRIYIRLRVYISQGNHNITLYNLGDYPINTKRELSMRHFSGGMIFGSKYMEGYLVQRTHKTLWDEEI